MLNVSEDHLDRYSGMDDYVAAKERIFKGRGVMVLNRDDDRCLATGRCGRRMVSFGLNAAPRPIDYGFVDGWLVRGNDRLIALGDLKLAGLHNATNAMAALALCEAVGIDPYSVLPALAGFSGLEHRVDFIAEINGVSFFDDSKGTNVGATLAAVQGMGRKVAVILGGEGKGQDFMPLRSALAQHARAVALIVPVKHCADMAEAVRWSATQAAQGDAVLLSPACASFDMFRNYAHRAEVFIKVVRGLESEAA